MMKIGYFRMLAIALIGIISSTLSATAFDLQGHRGARGLLPENTLPAFKKALEIGVSTLELDTVVTKDDVVVISHDRSLSTDIARDSQGNWITEKLLVRSMTFDALQAYDVGRLKPDSRTAKRFPDQQPVDGTRMPSLAQLFGAVKEMNADHIRFNIETKINPLKPEDTPDPETFARLLLKVVADHQMQARVSIQSFDWRTLQAVQKSDPSIDTVYLSAQQPWLDNVSDSGDSASDWSAGYKLSDYEGSVPAMVKAAGGKVWSPFAGDLSPQKVKEARELGLKTIPWTVNKPEQMRQVIALGVDGLITDYPDRLRTVMEELGMELPKPVN